MKEASQSAQFNKEEPNGGFKAIAVSKEMVLKLSSFARS
jgi:hypothetical protein